MSCDQTPSAATMTRIVDLVPADDLSKVEDEKPGGVGVRNKSRISRILIRNAGKRVQVTDETCSSFSAIGAVNWIDLKKSSTHTSEHRNAIGRNGQLMFEIIVDLLDIALENLSLRRIILIGLEAVAQFLSHERPEVVAAVTVRLRVQIKTDEREPRRFNTCQFIQVACNGFIRKIVLQGIPSLLQKIATR